MKDSDSGVGGVSGPPGGGGDFPRVNRRRHPRIQARLSIRTNGALPGKLTTRNISLGGAFGETTQIYPIGTRLSGHSYQVICRTIATKYAKPKTQTTIRFYIGRSSGRERVFMKE